MFVQKLFEREVPELSSGSVEVKAIAREPGERTKMVVASGQQGIDPVGSCVGQKGIRVKTVTDELGGERVDIIPWSQDIKELIATCLAPAEGLKITLDEKTKTATVMTDEDQLSVAIGRGGQNARLTGEVTGWKIDIRESKKSKKTKTNKVEDVADVIEKSDEINLPESDAQENLSK